MSTTFRPFQSDDLNDHNDLNEVLRIQKDNLVENLSRSQRKDGFLSVEFLPEQLKQMNSEIPIIVADVGPGLGGYVFGTTLESSRKIPILAHMMGMFSKLTYQGSMLDRYRSFMYGPICVADSFRGTGLLEGLFAELCHQINDSNDRNDRNDRFDVGISFVSTSNPRSLEAHVRKLGMDEIAQFEFAEERFHMLAFKVPRTG
jgi:hypothetical protein